MKIITINILLYKINIYYIKINYSNNYSNSNSNI